MPIVVQHTPDISLLVQAGYQVGAGQRNQWQAEMAQRERMQMRALQANLYSQQMAQDNAWQRMFAGNEFDMQRAAALQAGEQDFRKQMAEMDADNQMEQLRAEARFRQEQKLTEMETAGNADIVKFLLDQTDGRINRTEELLGKGYQFEGDGQAQYQAMLQKIAKIQQDPTVSGVARAQAIYQLVSDAPIPKLKPPSFDEQVKERTATVTTPDGRKITVAPVRELQVIDDGPPEKKPEKPIPKSPTEMVMQDPSSFNSLMKSAIEAMTTEETVDVGGVPKLVKKQPTPEQAAEFAAKFIRQFETQMKGGTSTGVPDWVSPEAEMYFDPATGEYKKVKAD